LGRTDGLSEPPCDHQGAPHGQTESAGIVLAVICWDPSAQRRCYLTGRYTYRPSVTCRLSTNFILCLSLSLTCSLARALFPCLPACLPSSLSQGTPIFRNMPRIPLGAPAPAPAPAPPRPEAFAPDCKAEEVAMPTRAAAREEKTNLPLPASGSAAPKPARSLANDTFMGIPTYTRTHTRTCSLSHISPYTCAYARTNNHTQTLPLSPTHTPASALEARAADED